MTFVIGMMTFIINFMLNWHQRHLSTSTVELFSFNAKRKLILDILPPDVLNIHLIDVVSGAIVTSLTHRRAKGPIHMVHSENWLVYSYYNDKVRRTEISMKIFLSLHINPTEQLDSFVVASVELYEGKTQANSTIWSSLDAPQLPMVEKQSYIVPANVVSLKETITEKGITNKHVLSMFGLTQVYSKKKPL